MTSQLPADLLILSVAALLGAGVLGAGFADRLRVPGLLLFLGLGIVIGDEVLGLVNFDDPVLAQAGATVALVLILFEGGLTTKPSDLRRASAPAGVLATLGVVITAAVVALGTFYLTDAEPITALLAGAVVASTDAAAVFTVIRRSPLQRRITSLLEVESGFNDPMAIMLTIGVLEAWRGSPGVVDWVTFGVVQLVGGAAVGLAVGYGGSWVLRRASLGAAGLYPVMALSLAGLSYGVSAAIGASGFLAVYVAGLLIGAYVPRHRRDIRTFHDGLANTAEIGLFLMLGVLVFPSRLAEVAAPALVITALLVVVARPVAVFVSLVWFRYGWREMTLVSWAGLRGAVPIVLATFPFTAGYPGGSIIFDVVFFVVLMSATVQGLTVGPLAGRLGLQASAEVWRPVAEALPLDGVDAELVEVTVTEGLPVEGKRVKDVPLPDGALLTTVVRNNRVIVPRGNTRMRAGDVLLVAAARRPGVSPTALAAAWAKGESDDAEPV
ncbi:MAG TPA: potassium/proton antiporter [Egibacteraceae bacterium]|nr:potassium/proton antiporter [Egibacteraceae bacterium]